MSQAVEEFADRTSTNRTGGLAARVAPLLLISAVVFAVDQLTKAVIRGSLAVGERWPADFELIRFSHVQNDGAAFGILQGSGSLLIITTTVAIVLIAATLVRSDAYPRSQLYALALILGGAIGNLADRIARGAVTDFIDPTHYPSFNLADSAIVIGVSAILLLTLFERSEGEPPSPDRIEPGSPDSIESGSPGSIEPPSPDRSA